MEDSASSAGACKRPRETARLPDPAPESPDEFPPPPGKELNVQLHTSTRADRHPAIFRAASIAMPHAASVLSYGCSTGLEPRTLAERYFPDARVVGLDVSAEALAQARLTNADLAGRVTIAHSTRENLSALGPYDVVFAMNVLCRWPETRGLRDIGGLFPFAQFCEQVALLDSSLNQGGLLVIAGSSFEFLHTPTAGGYDLVADRRVVDLGGVKVFDRHGLEVPPHKTTACIYRKRTAEDGSAGLVVYDERLQRIVEIPRDIPPVH